MTTSAPDAPDQPTGSLMRGKSSCLLYAFELHGPENTYAMGILFSMYYIKGCDIYLFSLFLQVTYADFTIYLLSTEVLQQDFPNAFDGYPTLAKLMKSVEQLPNIAKWLQERPKPIYPSR